MVMGAVQALQRAIQCIEKVRYEETGKGLTKVWVSGFEIEPFHSFRSLR